MQRMHLSPTACGKARPGCLISSNGSQSQASPDNFFHDLSRAAEDSLNARVEVTAGNRRLHDVAIAAVQLHALVNYALEQLGCPPLGHGSRFGAERSGIEAENALVYKCLPQGDLSKHLRKNKF